MESEFFIKGLALGFSIAAPVGPIGVLCIRRTLAEGRRAGFVSGLGAATADACYGALTGLGLTAITQVLVTGQGLIRGLGGLFLCYLGLHTFRARPAAAAAQVRAAGTGLWGVYASTLLLTLSNPMTILSFAAVFAGMGLTGAQSTPWNALTLVGGVFSGSAAWWLLLSGGVSLFRQRVSEQALTWVNRASGLILLAFGLLALWSLLAG